MFESVEFGYNKIVVERPQRDEAGNVILKRGKPVPDTSLRDTENVPLVQDIDTYFAREVLPYAPTPGSTTARPRWATRSP